MRVLFSVTVVLMVGLLMATVEAAKTKKGKGKGSKGTSSCTDWQYGNCVPSKGDCGIGLREGTCNGETKAIKCKVPCNWKKEFGADCKYKFGSWGECDSATNNKTRSGTLKKALFNADCQPTVKVSKPCPPKTKTKAKGKKSRLREN